ncbi:MAG: ROK family transcriptional regulator [Alphaproteobacteria bacterium]|nr:ROK family transcriptional regulator [Alphaproteobacteria bacterium]
MSASARISRHFSLRSVMTAIIHHGPISRAAIAKRTGLSKQTISAIVRVQEADGFVKVTGRTGGHIGRTAVTYEIVPSAAYIIAIDLGGTKVRVAIADLSCRILAEESAPTDARGGEDLIEQITALSQAVARKCRIPKKHIRLTVLGVPGVPDDDAGQVLMAPNVAGLDRINVKRSLSAGLGVETVIENDVNLAVFGEHWQGRGQGIDNLAFFALGTGIGAGLMVEGELLRGTSGAAGEIGYLPFGADPFDPASRHAGAFEREVATQGIMKRYNALAGLDRTVPEIFDLAAGGDEAAGQVLDETARLLCRAVLTIQAVIDPELVVLGGSIGAREELVSRVRDLLPLCSTAPVRIEASRLGPRAALVGAAALGLSRLYNGLFGAAAPIGSIPLPPSHDEQRSEAAE